MGTSATVAPASPGSPTSARAADARVNEPAGAAGEGVSPTWQPLYRVGGVAALIAAALTLSEVVVLALYPQPGTVSGWFRLFQSSWIVGLLDFWGLEVPLYAMFVLVFLALYVGLRSVSEARMAIATTFALLGIGIFLATNNPFAMLSLSNQYAAATTDAQRSTLLAAGQTLLTTTNQRGVGGFNMGLLLVSGAGLIASWVMVQSPSFRRSTAYVGMAAHALALADYLRQALTPSAIVALFVVLPNALLLVIWYILVGRRLSRMGRLAGEMLPAHPKQS